MLFSQTNNKWFDYLVIPISIDVLFMHFQLTKGGTDDYIIDLYSITCISTDKYITLH